MDKWIIFIMAMLGVLIVGGYFGFQTLNDVEAYRADTVAIADNAVPYGVVNKKTTLLITVNGSGTVGTIPFQDNYKAGDQIKLTALALDGWAFDHWQGGATGQQDSCLITLTEGENRVSAVFKQCKD